MDCDEEDNNFSVPSGLGDDESRTAVNSLILDYYKKFGRKRDLEQYFSLSTAQSDIRDPSSTFWTRMKTEQESSDSGERSDKRSESSQELCRISIKCSVPEPCTSQEEDTKTKTESVSPPIIVEDVSQGYRLNSEDDAIRSDDNNSQKSFDVMLDTSTNKPLSPSSSITSQRKLEWDSLADVGYANESDRKTSASSLSTLERLALKQQYSNNDTQQSNIGPPTAHSTPLDDIEPRSKSKKGGGKKSTKIHKKDIDFLEVNMPHSSNANPSQSINVNLTKHISFNVEKDGKVTVENVKKDVSISPEKGLIEKEILCPRERMDKEIQTSLIKTKDSSSVPVAAQSQKIPILISLSTLRNRTRRKKFRKARRKLKSKMKADKDANRGEERSGEQLSEAESFEYMPGHIYNQNQMTANERLSANVAGNKSSLESSAALTTDSSKGSKHSFSKDLEKSIDLLKNALQSRFDDADLKKKLIKQVCQRLLNSQYRDDDSTTDFLSGLSFSSKKLGLDERDHTTTSTSDANNSAVNSKRPKKSILRVDKFNPGSIASTSQSAPNLPVASKSDKLVTSNLTKTFTSSNTDSDMSSKEKTSSDYVFPKTSSDVLYKKYLQALKREEAYKRHLKDKEMFLKQKLVSSDGAFKVPLRVEVKPNNTLKDLINDLTRNNYDDGSGDASKLEGGPGSNRDVNRFIPNRNQRSHSVFTLSSGNSDCQKKPNLKKRLQCDIKDLKKPDSSKDTHYCCCPHHSGIAKVGVTDSSVQVNINNQCTDDTCLAKQTIPPRHRHIVESPINITRLSIGDKALDTKYELYCNNKADLPNNILNCKCAQLTPNVPIESNETSVHPCNNQNCPSTSKGACNEKCNYIKRVTKSSQTNMLLKMLRRKSSDQSLSSVGKKTCQGGNDGNEIEDVVPSRKESVVYEATRCLQTEISIDPRIAEPSLSDINIVNECECAKLISEHCRQPSKLSLTDLYIPHTDAETCTNNSESVKSSGTSNNDGNELEDINFQFNDKVKQHNVGRQSLKTENKNNAENFTIPIQGTNMTLMVSIGSERNPFMSHKAEEKVTEGIATDTVKVIEQATCLTEECSKGDQTDTDAIDHNSNCMVNKCMPEESKCITYSKTSLSNKPNRLVRTYSLYNFSKACSVQTDLCDSRDAETQESVPIETQTSDHKIERNKCKCGCDNEGTCNERCNYFENKAESCTKASKCSCGCSDSEQTCKGKCKDKVVDSNKSCYVKKMSKDSQCSTDTLRSSNRDSECINYKTTEKCVCGCGGINDKCLQDCINLSKPAGQCRKQSQDQKSEGGQNDLSDIKCSCGCDGTKDDCQEDCVQHTLTEQYRKGSVAKCIKKDSLDQKSDRCSCGCVGRKNECLENCIERNVTKGGKLCLEKKSYGQKGIPSELEGKYTLEEHCGIRSVAKTSYPKKNSLDQQNDRCSCGCDGRKDDCIGDCIERNVKHRDLNRVLSLEKKPCTQKGFSSEFEGKCLCGCDGNKDKCKGDCTGNVVPRDQCRKQSVYKASCGQSDILHKQSDNCSCGCGGTIDNCVKDCVERKISITESYKNSLYNKMHSKEGSCNAPSDKSACGCGNPIHNCKEDCSKFTQKRQSSTPWDKKEVGTQKDLSNIERSSQIYSAESQLSQKKQDKQVSILHTQSQLTSSNEYKIPVAVAVNSCGEQTDDISSDKNRKSSSEMEQTDSSTDPIINLIQDITRRYSKKDAEKSKRKKCFTDIVLALNYLLETDDCIEGGNKVFQSSIAPNDCSVDKKETTNNPCERVSKQLADKAIQLPRKQLKTRKCITESSELQTSTEIPGTSSDSATCKVLNKIKKECEKYHQKRCKIHSGKKCDASSSTSVNCDQCRRVHHCACRNHKCKGHKKSTEKTPKCPIAYNLILQTSESMVSEGTTYNEKNCQLKSIIVKVPKKKPVENIPFKEMVTKFEKNMPSCSPTNIKSRSRSLPNDSEISSMDEIMRKSRGCTVREYLEKNRPDFVERCAERQNCLKFISESRASERAVQRDLLSMHMAQLPDVTALDSEGLRQLARDLGRHMRKKQPAPKFISEREMKKHSKKIYKSLPEVVQKKEEIKKETIKKTNLLMACIFKKNLQKKTLRGSVNLSNYNTVIKI